MIMNAPLKIVTIDASLGFYSVQIQLQWDNSMTPVVIAVPGFYTGNGLDDVFDPLSLSINTQIPPFIDCNVSVDFDPFNANVGGKTTCGRFFIWTEDSKKVWGYGAQQGSNNTVGVLAKSNMQNGTVPLNSFGNSRVHFSKIIDNDSLCSGQAVVTLNTFFSRRQISPQRKTTLPK